MHYGLLLVIFIAVGVVLVEARSRRRSDGDANGRSGDVPDRGDQPDPPGQSDPSGHDSRGEPR
ncbi:hypothetical protein [Actinopolymorpha pittospori]|uniref:Uncharacterized protein n=1 Tax=Actinopolymorpha pittospori TaxID=648752 RepID=A0A927MRZ0_9ACTN|nr:hypothetical protein [Actinopolymorpha pittospori]MBE1605039.1 hypothetical protein [Actinopolymorpha pittospori]